MHSKVFIAAQWHGLQSLISILKAYFTLIIWKASMFFYMYYQFYDGLYS